MKNNLYKDGFVYKSMNRHRIKLLVRIAVILIIFALYFSTCKPYVLNVVTGSSPFDAEKYASDITSITPGELKDDGSLVIKNYTLKPTSYWQGEKYEFDVVPGSTEDTGITYTTKYTRESHSEEDGEGILSATLTCADINGVNTLVLAYPHQEVRQGATISGIFTEIPSVIKQDLSSSGLSGEKISPYMLDIRGIEMEAERFDIFLCSALLLIALFLIVKAVIYYVNPLLTPTYRSIDKYGDINSVVMDIENQLKASGTVKITKKEPIYTEDWIVSEDSFKLKIVKNHAKPQDSSRYGSKL